VAFIKKEVKRGEEVLHDNFNHMMHRLQQIEDGITGSRKNM
jgi:hypothetical protein